MAVVTNTISTRWKVVALMIVGLFFWGVTQQRVGLDGVASSHLLHNSLQPLLSMSHDLAIRLKEANQLIDTLLLPTSMSLAVAVAVVVQCD
jgi:hypothetical protein